MKSAKDKHKNTKEYTKYNMDYMFRYSISLKEIAP